MGLFDKKNCDICGRKIGLLGNRKLEDGNLCKDCAARLSPWFSERRRSTVEDIRAQLAYREDNFRRVGDFRPTRTFGEGQMLMVDEGRRWFCVARQNELPGGNPDILDLGQVTGCDIDIDETRHEIYDRDPQGRNVSFQPPRFDYSYDFYATVYVNHPWFDHMRFRLNASGVRVPQGSLLPPEPHPPAPAPGRPAPAQPGRPAPSQPGKPGHPASAPHAGPAAPGQPGKPAPAPHNAPAPAQPGRPGGPAPAPAPGPEMDPEYRRYEAMAFDLRRYLTGQ